MGQATLLELHDPAICDNGPENALLQYVLQKGPHLELEDAGHQIWPIRCHLSWAK